LRFPADTALAEQDRSRPLWRVHIKHYRSLATGRLAPSGDCNRNIDFVLLGFQTSSTVARFPLH